MRKIKGCILPAMFTTLWLVAVSCTPNPLEGMEKENVAINVEVCRVDQADIIAHMNYSGTIEASESIQLSFPVIGTVAKVLVAEGDHIKKGQLLATIDNETYQRSFDIAQASLEQAEDAYRRLQTMHSHGNLPEIKLIDVETKLQQARSTAAISKKNLDSCRLLSPTEAVVARKSIDVGMNAVPNITVLKLVKIDRVFAKVAVSENEIASIRVADKAVGTIPALSEKRISGFVKEIGVAADPLAHTYGVRILIDNSDREIKPGMICRIALVKHVESPPLAIPTQAIMVNGNKRYVYSVDASGQTAVRRNIKTGRLIPQGVEILDGLTKGDQVIVSGQHKLSASSLINIIGKFGEKR